MKNVELVCIICKKEDRGGGDWSYYDGPSTWEQEDGLCPDCRQELFPEFGKGGKRYMQSSITIGSRLRSVFNPFGWGANSPQ